MLTNVNCWPNTLHLAYPSFPLRFVFGGKEARPGHPCLTPLDSLKGLVEKPLFIMEPSGLVNTVIKIKGSKSFEHISIQIMVSNVFLKSSWRSIPGIFWAAVCSKMSLINLIRILYLYPFNFCWNSQKLRTKPSIHSRTNFSSAMIYLLPRDTNMADINRCQGKSHVGENEE